MNVELRGIEVSINWLMSLNELDSVRVLHVGFTKAIITKKHKEYVGFTEPSIWFR